MEDINPTNIHRVTDFFALWRSGMPTSLSGKNPYGEAPVKTGEWRNTPVDDTVRPFIKLQRSFNQQLSRWSGDFCGQSNYVLREKMKLSAELLLHCSPDAISLELTEEGSIFYTVRKNHFSLYLDHYLAGEIEGKDESIVSVFRNNDKILDFAGTMDETIVQLNKVLGPESILFPTFA